MSSTKKPTAAGGNPELLEVTQKLAKLDHNNLREFFQGFNEIYKDLNEKKLILEEEQIIFEESVPELQGKIKDAQKVAEKVRSETIKAFEEAENQRNESLKKLETESPELFEYLITLAEKKQSLDVLVFTKNYQSKIEEAKIMIDSRAFNQFREKINEISLLCQNSATISYVIEESFNENFNEQIYGFIEQFKKSLQEKFVMIKFPFETAVDHQYVKGELETVTEILKTLHELYQYLGENERISILEIIFNEFEKRFHFHFYGEKRTNDPSKPQWFYAELSAWISANVMFMEGYLQPLFNEIQPDVSVTEEFIESLVALASAKVRDLISSETFVNDKRLLSHLIDETVIFEKELQEVYLYPESSPHAISELCREDILKAWIEMERDTISAGIDNILSDQNAYDSRFQDATDLDEHLVPNFADAFVILMQAMTERYRSIPDERIQCQFLKLQLIIVDEFRSRIVQIGQVGETPLTYPNPQLLNALWYMTEILDEWSAFPDFIRLQSFATSGGNLNMKGTFDDQSGLYRHVWRQRARALTEYFADLIRHKLKPYASVKWFMIENRGQHQQPSTISIEFIPFLKEVERLIKWINKEISPVSVMTFYHLTNHEIWNAFDEMVIRKTNFNYHGAAQMFFDITTELIPMLESLYKWPKIIAGDETLNKKCVEILNSLKLLSLPTPTAILLKEEVERIPEQMLEEKLQYFDISELSKQRVLDLFNQRCDMNSFI